MGIRFLLLITALLALMFLASWLRTATPKQRVHMLRNIAIYGIGTALLILVMTGRVHWVFALVGAAAPWIQRGMMAMRAWNTFKAFGGPSKGKQSTVNTTYLNMTLDHDTGAIDGEILTGAFSGSKLSELDLEQLLKLLQDCHQKDNQSLPLIEAYLDKKYGTEWRGDEEPTYKSTDSTTNAMTPNEALSILGLEQGASVKDIKKAHRTLMQKMHPDRGGSEFLAARINQARDLLLGD
jgi:hypothetical protein